MTSKSRFVMVLQHRPEYAGSGVASEVCRDISQHDPSRRIATVFMVGRMISRNTRCDPAPPLGSCRLVQCIVARAEVQGEYPVLQGDIVVRLNGERAIEVRNGGFRIAKQRVTLADLRSALTDFRSSARANSLASSASRTFLRCINTLPRPSQPRALRGLIEITRSKSSRASEFCFKNAASRRGWLGRWCYRERWRAPD